MITNRPPRFASYEEATWRSSPPISSLGRRHLPPISTYEKPNCAPDHPPIKGELRGTHAHEMFGSPEMFPDIAGGFSRLGLLPVMDHPARKPATNVRLGHRQRGHLHLSLVRTGLNLHGRPPDYKFVSLPWPWPTAWGPCCHEHPNAGFHSSPRHTSHTKYSLRNQRSGLTVPTGVSLFRIIHAALNHPEPPSPPVRLLPMLSDAPLITSSSPAPRSYPPTPPRSSQPAEPTPGEPMRAQTTISKPSIRLETKVQETSSISRGSFSAGCIQ